MHQVVQIRSIVTKKWRWRTLEKSHEETRINETSEPSSRNNSRDAKGASAKGWPRSG